MKNCRPSGNSVGRQKFFCGDVTQAPHALCPNPPIPPYGAGAEIWAVGFHLLRQMPRRLKHATGMFLRAAFRIPPSEQKNNSHPNGWLVFGGEGGFEPTWRVTANSISSRARYDHFDTSPYRACLTGAYLFYHAMTENTSVFSEIVIIFISPGMHPADNGLPHSGKA